MGSFSLFVLNNLPWFWLAVTVLCIIIEGISMGTLTSIWFGCGAFVMIFLSFLPIPFRWQLLIFVVLSLVLLIFTRPFAVKKLKVKKTPTNSDSLIGKKVLVTEKITELEKGAVKINGVIWTARSENSEGLPKGTECIVTNIEGATAVVKKI
ncbi:MAG: NfeD family protein [Treponema sp.]|nr:NfeD family protein [Treponema sp.]